MARHAPHQLFPPPLPPRRSIPLPLQSALLCPSRSVCVCCPSLSTLSHSSPLFFLHTYQARVQPLSLRTMIRHGHEKPPLSPPPPLPTPSPSPPPSPWCSLSGRLAACCQPLEADSHSTLDADGKSTLDHSNVRKSKFRIQALAALRRPFEATASGIARQPLAVGGGPLLSTPLSRRAYWRVGDCFLSHGEPTRLSVRGGLPDRGRAPPLTESRTPLSRPHGDPLSRRA